MRAVAASSAYTSVNLTGRIATSLFVFGSMTESDRLEATYCAILGAQPGASRDELRRAYIARVKTAHPDLFRFNTALRAKAEEQMKQINEAYAYLKRLDDQRSSEEPEAEDDETVGEDPPEDEQDDEEDDSTDFEHEDEDEFTSDDWDDFDRWAHYREHHASERDQTTHDTEGPREDREPRYEHPVVSAVPRWPAMVAAISGCYAAIRVAAALSVRSFPVILAVVWTFTLIQGLRNRLVVYANIKDVVLSVITGVVMIVGHLTGNIYTALVGFLLCLISAIWSIRRNRSIPTGLAVCVFKITFSPCWVALMAAPWFLSDDQRSPTNLRLVAFRAFMMRLMFELVNVDQR
jgi:hypothetical protein